MKKILMTLTLAIGAAIAIPSIANAQSSTTATQTTKECCKEKKDCAKEGKACNKDGKACAKEGKACNKDGNACAKEGKACRKDGKACAKEGKACNKDGKACAKEGKACNKDGKACAKEGKACAKEGKACRKDGKACPKEGKACCKDGNPAKKGMHKARPGRINTADRRMASGKLHHAGRNPMMKGITLSEEQKQKMKELHEKHMAAEKNAKADMKAKSNEEFRKLRAEFDKEMEKILDKDQLKQYQANKAEMEAKRPDNAKSKRTDKKAK